MRKPALAPEIPIESFLGTQRLGRAVYEAVHETLRSVGPVQVRVSRSQIAFRRRRGFAWLWLPGRYLTHPQADVVLSIALARRDPSPRFREVVHPSIGVWMHHLEVRDVAEIDEEVVAWLAEAAATRG